MRTDNNSNFVPKIFLMFFMALSKNLTLLLLALALSCAIISTNTPPPQGRAPLTTLFSRVQKG
ncbi:MAG: hypothetical protein M0Q95_08905 [Porticoccaceae bacterium]|jgi:hypothetical protein|nr:hypothetical protein [Porticoccaceae bacterium]